MLPGQAQPARDSESTGLGLAPGDDGTLLYVDPNGMFTARIEADGRVSFADRWKRPDRGDSQSGKCCAPPPRTTSIAGGMPMSGPTEWIYKLYGIDINAREKAEFLAATLELRTARAIAFSEDRIDEALARLVEELSAIQRDDSLPPEQKRRRVFELWDDCDELIPAPTNELPTTAHSRIDEIRLDAAWQGRRKIERWVRLQWPAKGKLAYREAELEQLNSTRLSHESFDPYVEKPKQRPKPEPATEPPPDPSEPSAP